MLLLLFDVNFVKTSINVFLLTIIVSFCRLILDRSLECICPGKTTTSRNQGSRLYVFDSGILHNIPAINTQSECLGRATRNWFLYCLRVEVTAHYLKVLTNIATSAGMLLYSHSFIRLWILRDLCSCGWLFLDMYVSVISFRLVLADNAWHSRCNEDAMTNNVELLRSVVRMCHLIYILCIIN